MFPNLTNYQDEPESFVDGQDLLGEFVRHKLNTIIKIWHGEHREANVIRAV